MALALSGPVVDQPTWPGRLTISAAARTPGVGGWKDCGACRRSPLVLAPRPVWGPAAGERLIGTTRKEHWGGTAQVICGEPILAAGAGMNAASWRGRGRVGEKGDRREQALHLSQIAADARPPSLRKGNKQAWKDDWNGPSNSAPRHRKSPANPPSSTQACLSLPLRDGLV